MPNYRWIFEAAPDAHGELKERHPEAFDRIWGPMLPSADRAKLHAQAHMLQQMAAVYAGHALDESDENSTCLVGGDVAELKAEWRPLARTDGFIWKLRNWGGARYLVVPARPIPDCEVACVGPELTERDWQMIRECVRHGHMHAALEGRELKELQQKLRRAE